MVPRSTPAKYFPFLLPSAIAVFQCLPRGQFAASPREAWGAACMAAQRPTLTVPLHRLSVRPIGSHGAEPRRASGHLVGSHCQLTTVSDNAIVESILATEVSNKENISF